jgi:hypothetical protein
MRPSKIRTGMLRLNRWMGFCEVIQTSVQLIRELGIGNRKARRLGFVVSHPCERKNRKDGAPAVFWLIEGHPPLAASGWL